MNAPRIIATGMLAVAVLLLGACGTRHVSRDITPDGRAGEIVFPELSRIVLKEGTFPNIDSLRAVGPGATKDQLYHLLGRPHFREGYAGVREWDYLFHFRTPEGVVTCQYKVIFDKDYRGQSFHWAPDSCSQQLEGVEAAAQDLRFELSADALFAFDRHAADDILPDGREEIARIADALKAANPTSVQVIGHTDLLGSETYNQGLSQRRALTVRQLLIEGGISPAVVVAIGAGKSQPVKQCDDTLAHAARVACLQPNRRVEIVAGATR